MYLFSFKNKIKVDNALNISRWWISTQFQADFIISLIRYLLSSTWLHTLAGQAKLPIEGSVSEVLLKYISEVIMYVSLIALLVEK